jgi:hypothetical protein
MYPLTRDFPKPLLPVAGKPVLDYIMEQLVDLRDLRGIHVVTNAKFFAVFNSWRRGWSRVLKPKKVGIAVHNDGSTTNENRLGPAADLYCREYPSLRGFWWLRVTIFSAFHSNHSGSVFLTATTTIL